MAFHGLGEGRGSRAPCVSEATAHASSALPGIKKNSSGSGDTNRFPGKPGTSGSCPRNSGAASRTLRDRGSGRAGKRLHLEVYDLVRKTVARTGVMEAVPDACFEAALDVRGLPEGFYEIRCRQGGRRDGSSPGAACTLTIVPAGMRPGLEYFWKPRPVSPPRPTARKGKP